MKNGPPAAGAGAPDPENLALPQFLGSGAFRPQPPEAL